MNHSKKLGCIFFLLFFALNISIKSEEKEKNKSILQLNYYKLSDGNKLLKAKVLARINNKPQAISNVPVIFKIQFDTTTISIATIKTNEKGFAELYISKDYLLPGTKADAVKFLAEYSGNDSLEKKSTEISVKNAVLKMELIEIDSVKKVNILFTTEDTIPVVAATINLYVKRMHSLLPIGNAETDEMGRVSIDFPNDIPGDIIGNLIIIAKVEDSEEFANIETKEVKKWGLTLAYEHPYTPRALWSNKAPLWMIITTLILLTGVWVNFVIAIYYVSKIKKAPELVEIKEEEK